MQLHELPGETPVDDGPGESRSQREAHSARRRTQTRADRRRNAERRRELSCSGTDSGSDRAEGLSFGPRGLQQSLAESIHWGIREQLALLLAEQRGISGTTPEEGSAKRVSWHPDLEQQPLPTERELSPHPSRALSGVPLDEDHAAHASRALARRRRSSLAGHNDIGQLGQRLSWRSTGLGRSFRLRRPGARSRISGRWREFTRWRWERAHRKLGGESAQGNTT